jgi:hypothetical protein
MREVMGGGNIYGMMLREARKRIPARKIEAFAKMPKIVSFSN